MREIRPSGGLDFTDYFEGLGHRQMVLLVERRVSPDVGMRLNQIRSHQILESCWHTATVSRIDLLRLREALEASWDSETAYGGVKTPGNPAYGQCYPTSRVVQHFFPETEIAQGDVWTGERLEPHFWNIVDRDGTLFHIDLSWQQFPTGSAVKACHSETDQRWKTAETLKRVEMLLSRVMDRLIGGVSQ